MTGHVERYDRALCYGFIRGDDGVRYFVHRTDVAGPALASHDRVEFAAEQTLKGPRARRVQAAGVARP